MVSLSSHAVLRQHLSQIRHMQNKLCTLNSKLIFAKVGHRYVLHLLVSWLASSGLAGVDSALEKKAVYLEPSTVREFNKTSVVGSRLSWLKRPALQRPTLIAIITVLNPDDGYKVGV